MNMTLSGPVDADARICLESVYVRVSRGQLPLQLDQRCRGGRGGLGGHPELQRCQLQATR